MSRILVTCLLVVGAAGAAEAASDSLATLGIGTVVGVSRHATLSSPPTTQLAGEFTMQARLLRVAGLGLALRPTDPLEDAGRVVHDSRIKLSAILHLVPATPAGAYVKAGIGTGTASRIAAVDRDSDALQAGLGLEIHLGESIVVGVEGVVMIGGLRERTGRGTGTHTTIVDQVNELVGGSTLRLAGSLRYYL